MVLIKSRDKITLEKGKIKLLLKEDTDLIHKLSVLVDLYQTIANELTQAILYGKIVNVNEIIENIQKYKELLEYDNYDKYFEKYLTFEEMK